MSFFPGLYIPNPLCLLAGHAWGPWLVCRDGVTRRFCDRCPAVNP